MEFPSQEHIEAAQKAADILASKTGIYVWPSVTLAQACIESANWTKLSGKNNGFGIKATEIQVKLCKASYIWTTEFRNGQPIKIKQWFADFDSLDDAYLEHARLLATNKIYAKAWATTHPDNFVAAIAPHYATAPDYADVIIRTMEKLDLYQYDEKASYKSTAPNSIAKPVVLVGATAAALSSPTLLSWGKPYIEAGIALLVIAFIAKIIFSFKAKPEVTPINSAKPLTPQEST